MEPTDVAIIAVRDVGPDTVAVELASPSGLDARPGQFVKLSATVDGDHVSRFYTLSSSDSDETFETTITVDPDGELGPWIADPDREGDTVRVEGPYGTAYYEGEDRSLLLAGGPGVGAAVGIGERALADGNEIAVIYRDDGPVHEDRLARLRDRGATVEITDGAITDLVADQFAGDEQVFVYGFQEFVTESLDAIEAAGGDPDDAKVENYN